MDEKEKTAILKDLEKLKTKHENIKQHEGLSIALNIIFGLTLILSLGYLLYNLIFNQNQTNQLYLIINSFIILIIIILIGLSIFSHNEKGIKLIKIGILINFIFLIGFQFLTSINIIKLPTEDVVPNLINKSINEAIKWANDNKIDFEQSYEFSENVDEFNIIAQSVAANTLVKNIKKINFTVSNGPNYDKLIIASSMVGWKIDEAIEYINENLLNNVEINYHLNDEFERDVIFKQSINGQMRRNDKLILDVSLGVKDNLLPIKMENLKNKSLFESTLWLKRNGIKYKLEYVFNDKVKRNFVISQNELKDSIVTPFETVVTLIISKGKEIKIPNFNNMNIDEITKWIIDNNLKVKYSDSYHSDILIGKLISSNYKENDIVEEETTIELVISKGQLRLPTFKSINEFREWAAKYNIITEEKYEYNEKVKKGGIIKFSHQENDIISPKDVVVVYISDGTPVTIPNFVGKHKNDIRTTCSRIGLNCTFYYQNYSNSGVDIALSQNKRSGSTVIAGTYVNIGLSKGAAKKFTVEITESQLSIGNADGTISSLKSYFAQKYPNVKFIFYKKNSNTYDNSGFIHESSPIKDGSTVTQGNEYQVWITN